MDMPLTSPMPPPWLRYPAIPQASIGWRTGSGEDYAIRFWEWLDALPADQQADYRRSFPPPKTWTLVYEDTDDMDDDAWAAALDGMDCTTSTHTVCHWEKDGARRYTRDWLTRRLEQGHKPTCLMFWKPGEPATAACLSQWQPSSFMEDRERYLCAEQYMMAEKARLFGDTEIERQIMATGDPATMRRLGKKVHGFDAKTWNHAKHSVVLNGSYAKFSQDEALRRYLLGTADAVLVEASPFDTVWGIGLGATADRADDPAAWRGQNMLGFALMEVRDEIARVWANAHLIDWTQYPSR